MQRVFKLSVLCLAAGVVSACKPDTVTVTGVQPTAGVRFINAVPDSGGANGFDMRFIDIVENNAAFSIPFRNNVVAAGGVPASTLIEYKAALAQSGRHFRIFLSDTLQAVASTVIKDSTVDLVSGHNYTFLLWGAARAGQMKLTIIDETVADPSPSVALRVINTGTTAVDVRVFVTALPAAATWSVAGMTVSPYVNTAAATIKFDVQPSGGGTTLFADVTALTGQQPTVDIEGTPGTTVAGSAVSALIFPRSTVGSKAPQGAAFQVPAISFTWDRRPPRPTGT